MRILLTVAAAFAAGSLLSLVPAKAESPGYSDAGNQRSGAGLGHACGIRDCDHRSVTALTHCPDEIVECSSRERELVDRRH